MTRKKLLFVSPRFLFPSDSGGKIRTRDILRGMLGGKFEITLTSPAPANASSAYADDLSRVCDHFRAWPPESDWIRKLRRYLGVFARLPLAAEADKSAAGRRCVASALAERPDLVVVDFPHATVLLPDSTPIASVLFTHNVEAEIFRRHAEVAPTRIERALWRSQARKMKGFEDDVIRRFDGVIAVSPRDARHFRAICGDARVHPIPTGVDLDYFAFEPSASIGSDDGTLVFTGSMDWRANVDGIRFMMESVWPSIAAARPNVRMVVVGHSPPPDLVRTAAERGYRWRFTGYVDDVRRHVHEAQVYVIPLRVGGGTRIKAFEAMAMGCPVVSTAVGIEGLPVQDGEHCLIGDSPAALASAILRLLDDGALRSKLATNARRMVEARYSHRVAAAVFEDACVRALAMPRRFAESEAGRLMTRSMADVS